jgi:antitoxin component YwqK of YwqJK toxin-antitoxin module
MKTYHPNGLLFIEVELIDEKYHGPFAQYYNNGAKEIECTYVHGKKQGVCKLFYPNGVLQQLITYKDNKLDGIYQEWNTSGQLLSTKYHQDDKLHGLYIVYDEDSGKEKLVASYKEGLLHGTFISCEKGQKTSATTFIEGKKNGFSITYHSNGNVCSKTCYVDDVSTYIETFYEDGQKETYGKMNNGILHGEFKKWRPDGTLAFTSVFVDGLKHGPCKLYDQDGNITYSKMFVNDEEQKVSVVQRICNGFERVQIRMIEIILRWF